MPQPLKDSVGSPFGGTSARGSKVSFLGYGRFGRGLAQMAQEAGLQVLAFDPGAAVPETLAARSPAELVAGASEIIIAVPTARTAEALECIESHLRPEQLVMDVGSVKSGPVKAMTAVLGNRIPWITTHPLFGSSDIALGERPLLAVVCPNMLHSDAISRAKAFYERIGCVVTEQSAEEHDLAMARSHALAFFIAKALSDMGATEGQPFTPPSFQAMSRVVERVRTDAAHLFVAIEQENPYAADARQELLDTLAKVHNALEAIGSGYSVNDERAESLGIPDLETPAPELKETRELIDEVDQELIGLLARRAQLSRRAGAIKSERGKAVRDPARETSLLEERKSWASEYDLEAEGIADIFTAILRFSRSLQSN